MNEPIDHRSELDKGQKGGREFFVAGGDAAHGLDAPKEVFDVMAVSVVSAVEVGGLSATAFGRNAAASALGPQPAAEVVGVKALVGYDKAAPSPRSTGSTASRSWRGPGASATARARPCRFTMAANLVFSPPLVRPIAWANWPPAGLVPC